MKKGLLTLEASVWYAWEMLPGYMGRYYSPILIYQAQPLKTGRDILRVSFFNAGYAQGVQDFRTDLQIIHRAKDYLIAKLIYAPGASVDRCAIITPVTLPWLAAHCRFVLKYHDLNEDDLKSDAQHVLRKVYGQR